jgi:uncharacterized protein (UPF0212 family)
MTNEEAYKWIYVHFAPCGDETKQDEAISIALKAIAKQIPKKPYTNVIHYPYTSDLTTVQCPNCKRRLRTRRTQAKGDRFCPDCGQAIDWEGE